MNIINPNYCIAAVSINQTPLDWSGNCKRILDALESLAKHSSPGMQADLVLFPELCVSGYACEDAFHSPQLWQQALESTQELAKACQKRLPACLVVVGLPFYFEGGLYNCCALLGNGSILALVPKSILANNGVHYEARWFCAFRQKAVHTVSLGLQMEEVPFGLMAFSHKGIRFIIEICRDAWALTRPAYALGDSDFDIILNPSASCFSFDKYKLRRNIILESSRRFGTSFVFSNLLGCEAGSLLYDGHILAASNGELIAESLSFSFQDFICGLFQLDPGPNRAKRVALRPTTHRHLAEPLYGDPQSNGSGNGKSYILKIETPEQKIKKVKSEAQFLFLNSQGILKNSTSQSKNNSMKDSPMNDLSMNNFSRNEQFLKTLCLGLFDYLRKSKARGFVISLSGGADSSTCALLVYCMLAHAITELGVENALKALGRADLIRTVSNKKGALKEKLKEIMPHFLYTLYQSTKNNSKQSARNARQIADFVSSTHGEVDIQMQIDSYVHTVENLMQAKLDSNKHDLALQNIQARSRAPLAWFLANLRDSILLCTANRSEIAVGYSTMDGDTAGGLAPLGGISKTFLLQWLRSMEKGGDPLLGPIPELADILSRRPSAELRPQQDDEEDLMPYEVLDKIADLAIQKRKGAHEILKILLEEESQKYDSQILQSYVTRFFKLFSQSQWKRERFAPAFHIDEENLDPRSFYRFPVLNGLEDNIGIN